jgi:hypothetical protein
MARLEARSERFYCGSLPYDSLGVIIVLRERTLNLGSETVHLPREPSQLHDGEGLD